MSAPARFTFDQMLGDQGVADIDQLVQRTLMGLSSTGTMFNIDEFYARALKPAVSQVIGWGRPRLPTDGPLEEWLGSDVAFGYLLRVWVARFEDLADELARHDDDLLAG